MSQNVPINFSAVSSNVIHIRQVKVNDDLAHSFIRLGGVLDRVAKDAASCSLEVVQRSLPSSSIKQFGNDILPLGMKAHLKIGTLHFATCSGNWFLMKATVRS